MITILTRFGHSRENYLRLLAELREVPGVRFVAILNNSMAPVDGVECVTYEPDYAGDDILNFGYRAVKTPWLFVLDSDEWYTPLQLSTVMPMLLALPAEVEAASVQRRNFEPMRNTSWDAWPDWQTRFFRCTPQLAWHGTPHEAPNVRRVTRFEGTSFAIVHDHIDVSIRIFMEPYFAQTRKE